MHNVNLNSSIKSVVPQETPTIAPNAQNSDPMVNSYFDENGNQVSGADIDLSNDDVQEALNGAYDNTQIHDENTTEIKEEAIEDSSEVSGQKTDEVEDTTGEEAVKSSDGETEKTPIYVQRNNGSFVKLDPLSKIEVGDDSFVLVGDNYLKLPADTEGEVYGPLNDTSDGSLPMYKVGDKELVLLDGHFADISQLLSEANLGTWDADINSAIGVAIGKIDPKLVPIIIPAVIQNTQDTSESGISKSLRKIGEFFSSTFRRIGADSVPSSNRAGEFGLVEEIENLKKKIQEY